MPVQAFVAAIHIEFLKIQGILTLQYIVIGYQGSTTLKRFIPTVPAFFHRLRQSALDNCLGSSSCRTYVKIVIVAFISIIGT